MLIRTEAVPLRAMDFRETSQIVTFYTRSKGKISCLARGARTAKNRFGSTLQPMSYIEAVIHYKPNRTLQTLSETSHVLPLHNLSKDIRILSEGLKIIELVNVIMHEEEQNNTIFNLLLQVLVKLNKETKRPENIFPYFQLQMAHWLGFTPDINRELVQSITKDGGRLLLESGRVQPAEDAFVGQSLKASRAALRAFAVFGRATLEDVMRMDLRPPILHEAGRLIEAYLRFHIDDLRPSKAAKIIAELNVDYTVNNGDDLPPAEGKK